MTALIIAGVVLCACIFAAMAAAPYCEPAELKAADDTERDALRREANACLRCSTEAEACGHCIAAKYSRRVNRRVNR